MGIPQDFLWVWDGYGDINFVSTAALVIAASPYPLQKSVGGALLPSLEVIPTALVKGKTTRERANLRFDLNL